MASCCRHSRGLLSSVKSDLRANAANARSYVLPPLRGCFFLVLLTQLPISSTTAAEDRIILEATTRKNCCDSCSNPRDNEKPRTEDEQEQPVALPSNQSSKIDECSARLRLNNTRLTGT